METFDKILILILQFSLFLELRISPFLFSRPQNILQVPCTARAPWDLSLQGPPVPFNVKHLLYGRNNSEFFTYLTNLIFAKTLNGKYYYCSLLPVKEAKAERD